LCIWAVLNVFILIRIHAVEVEVPLHIDVP